MRWFFPAGAKNCTMTLASAVRLGTGVLLWIGRLSSASRSADLESAFGLAAGFATDGPVEEGTPHGPDFGPGRDRPAATPTGEDKISGHISSLKKIRLLAKYKNAQLHIIYIEPLRTEGDLKQKHEEDMDMTYSELRQMDTMVALALLARKLEENSECITPIAAMTDDQEMDKALERLTLVNLAEAFGLTVLQSELERTGRDEQLSELAEAAVEVVNAAYDLSDDIGELEGDLFTEAMELVDGDDESDFDDDEDFDDEDFYDGFEDEDFDDDGEYVEMTDAEVEAMQAVGKALAECGLLTPGEQLYIVHGDPIGDGDLEAGQRLIAYDAPVGELVTVLRDAMAEAGHIGEGQEIYLVAGAVEDEPGGRIVSLEDLEGEDAELAKALIGHLKTIGEIEDASDCMIGVGVDGFSGMEDSSAIAVVRNRDGKYIMVVA